jgi:hypothetical protein
MAPSQEVLAPAAQSPAPVDAKPLEDDGAETIPATPQLSSEGEEAGTAAGPGTGLLDRLKRGLDGLELPAIFDNSARENKASPAPGGAVDLRQAPLAAPTPEPATLQEMLLDLRALERDLGATILRKEHELLAKAHAASPAPTNRWTLGAPLLFACVLPAALFDAAVAFYQKVCFPVYGIPQVRRGDYIVSDREAFSGLPLLERLSAAAIGYVRGVLAFTGEAAGRTEQFWCPIKHARALAGVHSRYDRFFDFGDETAWREGLRHLRKEFQDVQDSAGEASSSDGNVRISIDELLLEIRVLDKRFCDEILRRQRMFLHELIRLRDQNAAAASFWERIRKVNWKMVASAPAIYACFFPALLLDAAMIVFHRVGFPLLGIPLVRRSDYIAVDREYLSYLTPFQRFNCLYCSYMNGAIAYFAEIAGRADRFRLSNAKGLRAQSGDIFSGSFCAGLRLLRKSFDGTVLDAKRAPQP